MSTRQERLMVANLYALITHATGDGSAVMEFTASGTIAFTRTRSKAIHGGPKKNKRGVTEVG